MADFGADLVGMVGNVPSTFGGGGGGFDFSSIFQNKAFLQALGTLGAGLDPQGVGGVLGNLSNSWIAAKNQSKMIGDQKGMLQQLLAGGGNLSMDGKGMKLFVPNTDASAGGTQQQSMNTVQPMQANQSMAVPQQNQISPQQARQVNPFVSSQQGETPLADLAGLTPENINQAMAVALGQANLKRQSTADMYNAMYNQGYLKLQQQQAQTANLNAWKKINEIPKTVDVNVNGQIITADPKEALSYYAKVNDLPVSYDTYKIAKGDPEYKQFLKDTAQDKRMQINIGETIEKTKAIGTAKSELKLTDPDYIPNTVSEMKKDSYAWDESIDPYVKRWEEKGIKGSEARRLAEKAYVMDDITRRLEIRYGKGKVEVDIVDDEVIWKVDGKVIQRY